MGRPNVIVLGCGPAGLIAAYAAQREFQANITVFSVKRPSQLFGCQYLHEPIPGVTLGERRLVRYVLFGTKETYREKVYGSLTPPVSPQQYEGSHYAWDLRQTYAALWEMYEPTIQHFPLKPTDILPILNHYMPDLMISSIPLPALCQMGDMHTFSSVKCWAIGDAPELGRSVPISCEPSTVHCDGTKNTSWYRISNVYGHVTVEWPGHGPKPPWEGISSFEKPLVSNCDCMPSVLRVGRYGRWTKGVLSHEAYGATVNRLKVLKW